MFKQALLWVIVPGLLCCITTSANAQPASAGAMEEAEPGIYMLSPNITVAITSIASASQKTITTAPGIVSVITHEEILNSGARNLNDLLNFVPGFVSASEIHNTTGYIARGLWSMEGKLLIMIDGIPVNNLQLGSPIFAGQFIVDNIERIEIIRGPGSAIYGGNAELGVINIITRGPDNKGGTITATYGLLSHGFGEEMGSISYGNRFKDLGVSFSGTFGENTLSDKTAYDNQGQAYPMKDNSGQKIWSGNLGITYKDFSLRFLASSLKQEYHLRGYYNPDIPDPADPTAPPYENPTEFTPGPTRPLTTTFEAYNVDMRYAWSVLDNLKITPYFDYTKDFAWQTEANWAYNWGTNYDNFPAQKIKGGFTADYIFNKNIELTCGGEYTRDYLWSKPSQTALDNLGAYWYSFYVSNDFEIDNYTTSLFGDINLTNDIADITIGGRYDNNTQYGSNLVPRFSVIKEFGNFHIKLLASFAYRQPNMKILYWYNPQIEPERSSVQEAELGYNLTQDSLITLNIFNDRLKNVIVYDGFGYSNDNHGVGTWGVETQYRINKNWGNVNIAYSFYRAYSNSINVISAHDAGGDNVNGVTIGAPTHKATLNASFKAGTGFTINPGLIYMSQRYYRYDTVNLTYMPPPSIHILDVPNRLPAAWLINLYLRKTFANDTWEVGGGVFNILNQKDSSPMGYYIGGSPVPGSGREFILRATYNF